MTTAKLLQRLLTQGIVSEQQSGLMESYLAKKPFSIHRELRSVLYIGILLFASGLGVIIYKNIDTIGHQIIIALIAFITIVCFYYSFTHSPQFSWHQVKHTDRLSAYSLFFACTAFLILESYLQFQYKIFGARYGLAVFIPTVLFFFCAYRFDHKGVLSMATTGLASWLGLTIAPLSILSRNNFTDSRLIITSLILGIALIIISRISELRNIKKHFAFSYLFLGGNLAVLASVSGLFIQENLKVLYLLTGAGLCTYFILQSRRELSLLVLLMGVMYGYIILTYCLFKALPETVLGFLGIYYFLFSSVGVVLFLLNYKKFLGIRK